MKLEDFGKTITFMPDATRGAVRFLTADQLKSTGTKNVVVNTLHLMIHPGSETIQKLGGIHSFMNWHEGFMLSDSGGFQVFSLLHSKKWEGKIDNNGATFKSPREGKKYVLTPESSIEIQMQLGTDILVALDDCRDAQVDRKEAEISVERTLEWGRRSLEHFKKLKGHENGKIISAVVQGANYLDLREYCAKELSKMGFDGYNFGGYVIDSDGKLVVEEMKVVIENTPKDKFKYAMGVGKPQDIIDAAKLGYTVFDTVLVTRNARHGTLYSFNEENLTMRIKNAKYSNDLFPIEDGCDCEACRNHTRAYVHHMIRIGEATGMTLATIHNLRFYQRLVEKLSIEV
ncbi:MAG TPA: tRNA guanosine(34) transglycosylase Tgt [Candidatus Dojkabacteria bacterium]|nr:tRNA guanosine(34) transglycosylase Tgt [Candidatus Dojkabacteria bacterium]